jgi:charged multivesicular body protein 1
MPSLDKQLFELRFAAKSLERASHKSTRLMGEEKAKVLKDMQRNNPEGARIHAEAAVRHQHESLQLLKLSNRVDAMASQLTGAMKMRGINDSMAKVVDLLCRAVEGERLVEMTKVYFCTHPFMTSSSSPPMKGSP